MQPSRDLVEAILADLRAATTVAAVNEIARQHGDAVKRIAETPDLAVRAIHIRNLAKYRRATIEQEARKAQPDLFG